MYCKGGRVLAEKEKARSINLLSHRDGGEFDGEFEFAGDLAKENCHMVDGKLLRLIAFSISSIGLMERRRNGYTCEDIVWGLSRVAFKAEANEKWQSPPMARTFSRVQARIRGAAEVGKELLGSGEYDSVHCDWESDGRLDAVDH